MENHPQTVSFYFQLLYSRAGAEVKAGPVIECTIEEMNQNYAASRHRRAINERATGYRWRSFMTPYGVDRCNSDRQCRLRHEGLNTEWKTVGF
jgi:hypothetical protein